MRIKGNKPWQYKNHDWFAWRPVKTIQRDIVWLEWTTRVKVKGKWQYGHMPLGGIRNGH